ncbi:MAG: hypothetical protein V1672_04280 [Candidatus Diapherotrites archaeon]
MSLTLLAAMKRCKTPEEFIERFVLKTSSRKGTKGETSLQLLGLVKNAKFEKGYFTDIAFTNKAKPNQICNLQITQTVLTDPEKIRVRGTAVKQPYVKIFNNQFFRISNQDWKRAERIVGVAKTKHPHEGGSISRDLLIPKSAIAHWNVKERTTKTGRKQAVVELNENVYSKLNNLDQAHSNMGNYFLMLKFVGGKITEEKLSVEVGLHKKRHKRAEGFQKLPLLDQVQILTARHHQLFIKLSTVKNEAEATTLIQQHFKVPEAVALMYAGMLMRIFSTEGGRHSALELNETLKKSKTEREKSRERFPAEPVTMSTARAREIVAGLTSPTDPRESEEAKRIVEGKEKPHFPKRKPRIPRG